MQQRIFINSLFPKNAAYSWKIPPGEKIKAWVENQITHERSSERSMTLQGKTLTEMEVAWGAENLKKGLDRGDVYLNVKDKLYYVRTAKRSVNEKMSDIKSKRVYGEAGKEETSKEIDNMDWETFACDDLLLLI